MCQPGIEPGPHAWEARILTIELLTHIYVHICIKGLPGFEPGLRDSESLVITDYTTGPQTHFDVHRILTLLGVRIELTTSGL